MSPADLDAFLYPCSSEARAAIKEEIQQLQDIGDAYRTERDRWQRAAKWLFRALTEGES